MSPVIKFVIIGGVAIFMLVVTCWVFNIDFFIGLPIRIVDLLFGTKFWRALAYTGGHKKDDFKHIKPLKRLILSLLIFFLAALIFYLGLWTFKQVVF